MFFAELCFLKTYFDVYIFMQNFRLSFDHDIIMIFRARNLCGMLSRSIYSVVYQQDEYCYIHNPAKSKMHCDIKTIVERHKSCYYGHIVSDCILSECRKICLRNPWKFYSWSFVISRNYFSTNY